jgi:hypothetical protein
VAADPRRDRQEPALSLGAVLLLYSPRNVEEEGA